MLTKRVRQNKNWGGRIPTCLDCSAILKDRRSTRCRPCNFKLRTGVTSPSWKGGRIKTKAGYILVKAYNHPYGDRQNYVMEHRLVMEAHLGRYLLPAEHVHHINGIKDDNGLENLKLFQNQKEHANYHWVELRTKNFCCPNCGCNFGLEEITHGKIK